MAKEAHPICGNFLEAAQQAGFKINHDYNGAEFEGAGIYEANIRNGLRDSSNTAYLKPALKRSNLTLWHHATAEKILIDENKKATAVQLKINNSLTTVSANKEVIVAAGAVDTPKLLQLSGVGDKTLLNKHAIKTHHHLPAVGQNLQDHLGLSYYYRANVKTLNDDFLSLWGKVKAGITFLSRRGGPLALSVNQAGGFFRGSDQEPLPNLQLYFNPLSYEIPNDPKANLIPEPYSGFLIYFNACRPTSRGTIEIASNNPKDPPLIKPNYLSTDKDQAEVIQGHQLVKKLSSMPALKTITDAEIKPADQVSNNDSLINYFKENAGSIYHLCGTCAMGQNPNTSVVDHRLKVHGIKGLRIADASIFPNITSGNINAPVMMVAEKAAQMIIEDNE